MMGNCAVRAAQAQACTNILGSHGHLVAIQEVRAYASLKFDDMQTYEKVRLAAPKQSACI